MSACCARSAMVRGAGIKHQLGPFAPLRLTNSHTLEITTDPSPTEDATRLTEPARTSPTAKMPGNDVAKGEDAEPSPKPVITKPLSSSFTRPESHSVFGAAPTMM